MGHFTATMGFAFPGLLFTSGLPGPRGACRVPEPFYCIVSERPKGFALKCIFGFTSGINTNVERYIVCIKQKQKQIGCKKTTLLKWLLKFVLEH
jgi:hypothetical protein